VKAIADVLCNGSSRQQNNLVKCFDVAHFRSMAAKRLMGQTAKDRSPRVSAQRPRSRETQMMGVLRRFAAHVRSDNSTDGNTWFR
jgi:hypothetical protein